MFFVLCCHLVLALDASATRKYKVLWCFGAPGVENPILEKVRSGGSGQTFALPTKKKVSEQMEVTPAPTYASILKKGHQ